MTTCTWAGFTAVRICIVVFSFSKITAVLCFWHNTGTAMSFFHNLTSISANQHFCFVVTVSWQQNFISNCPLLFWRPCAQSLVHLYFFQTHVVLFIVLLVITHCWPEIKHQEYANIYTQTSLVSGCSPPQLYHWENPSFPKKNGKRKPPNHQKRLWKLNCTYPREPSHIPAIPVLQACGRGLQIQKTDGEAL